MGPIDEAPRPVFLTAPHPAPAVVALRSAEGPTGLELARVLFAGRRLLLGLTLLSTALAAGYLLVATPRWRGDALLRIEERDPSAAAVDPIMTGIDVPLAKAEIEMLRARTLLVDAVERLGLDVTAQPRRVPLIGKLWARLSGREGLVPSPPGLARFAWGGEKISLGRLDLPAELVDASLVLVADGEGGFRLRSEDGATLAEGAVGSDVQGGGAASPVRIRVTELVARPGTEFVVRKLRVHDVVAALQLRFGVEERGKDTGVVALRLEGTDRARVAETLRTIVDTYIRQNGERTSARASRTVALLDERLPVLRGNVERAETVLETWKLKNGTVDVSAETRALLERSVELGRRISDLHAKRAELAMRYTDRHPGLGELSDQIGGLQIQQRLIEGKLKTLPTTELQGARLTRDVNAATALYLQVLEKAQQYRIAAAGTVGSASLVDAPSVPEKPAAPRAPPVIALALLLGVTAGSIATLIRSRLGGAGDPVEVEVATGLPVLGTVPHSSTEASLARVVRRRLTGRRAAALHAVNPDDVAVEDLRTLRTNLAVALRGAGKNIVAIGGPAPGVGKSFVCVNLALLLASTRRRVLLVDADLRRGRLHREFGLERTPGVAEVIGGSATFAEAVRASGTDGLDVLSAGAQPEDPAALLERPRFGEMLAEAAKLYDVVLVDSAAILAVTDPALVARHAGLSLLVLRAGEHPVDEIALAVKRLRQSGARVDGAILNDVRAGRYARYRYDYRVRAGA